MARAPVPDGTPGGPDMPTVDTTPTVDERHQELVEQLEQVTAERDALRLRLAGIHALSVPGDLPDVR